MIESDTIKLLRECDSGIDMGISALDEVLEYSSKGKFENILRTCKQEHERLKGQVDTLLDRYHDDGKAPNPIIKGMSWMKTNVMLAVNESDKTIADLITDGGNMGVKSLSRYLNQYQAADEKSKNIAKELIRVEEQLVCDMRAYL